MRRGRISRPTRFFRFSGGENIASSARVYALLLHSAELATPQWCRYDPVTGLGTFGVNTFAALKAAAIGALRRAQARRLAASHA